jgi:FAD/FMN-containing dehydrogenase
MAYRDPVSQHGGRLKTVVTWVATLLGVSALLVGGLYVVWDRQLSAVTLSEDAFHDVARLHPVQVREIRAETRREELVAVVNDARERGLKNAIAGSRHSQGGHTYYRDAVVLDMREYDQILALDTEARLLTGLLGVGRSVRPHALGIKLVRGQRLAQLQQ